MEQMNRLLNHINEISNLLGNKVQRVTKAPEVYSVPATYVDPCLARSEQYVAPELHPPTPEPYQYDLYNGMFE